MSNPDNLAWMPTGDDKGILLIAEDTDREPNRLWAWQDDQLVALLAAPPGAEVSGVDVVPVLWGHRWITVSIQHPTDAPAVTGMLGPLPPRP